MKAHILLQRYNHTGSVCVKEVFTSKQKADEFLVDYLEGEISYKVVVQGQCTVVDGKPLIIPPSTSGSNP